MALITRVSTPLVFEGVLQRERVLHRGDHADVVGRGAVEALGGGRDAAEDVAAADDDGKLDARFAHVPHVPAIS